VLIGKARVEETPADYTLEVVLRDEVTAEPQARTPYAEASLSDEARWYAGDLHVHSHESGDARPLLPEIATFARGRGLDFVVISDHNVHTALDFFGDAQAQHPDLLLVPGVEFTTYAGHANGIGATAWVDFRVGDTTTIDDAAAAFAEQGALFAVNHPVLELGGLCIGCAWEQPLDASLIDAVELTNGGGLQPFGQTFIDAAMAYWDMLCDQGHHVAPIGGSDDHKAGVDLNGFQSPIGDGTTMVQAEFLSPSAIVEGIRQGRTVVKLQGPGDPMVDFDAPGRQADTVRGTTVELTATVTGAAGQSMRLVVDGVPEAALDISDDPHVQQWTVETPASGQTRYRVEVLVDGSLRTVTSHLWLEHGEDPEPSETSTGADEPPTTSGPSEGSTSDAPGSSSSSDGPVATSDDANGCGCRARGESPVGWGLLVLAVVGLRRRCGRRCPRPTS
jgi:hypothetical protein